MAARWGWWQQLKLRLHPLPSSHVFEALEAARASSKPVPLAVGTCQGAGRPPSRPPPFVMSGPWYWELIVSLFPPRGAVWVILFFGGGVLLGQGLPWWLRWQRICLHCRRPRFDPWVWKTPWRRKWQPTLVFLPGEFHGQRSHHRLQSMGSQRVRHDGVSYTFHFQLLGQTQTNLAPLSPVYWTFGWIS